MRNNPFHFDCEISWCPGCGNFGIIEALKETLDELGLKPHNTAAISGIGQAAKLPHYIKSNGFNGLHGRALPVAMGVKIANKDLVVFVNSGDGDSYGEGGNHLIHNIRRNIDVTHFVHNNQIYGLTKGQGSPTTELNQVTTMQFDGVKSAPFNPIAFAISQDCSFVARTFSGDKEHMKAMMKAAIQNKGYSLLDILQPCVTFNKVNTFKWYKDRIYYLDDSYDPYNKEEAFKKALEWGDAIPIGIIYRSNKPSFIDRFNHLKDAEPLVKRKWSPMNAKAIMEEFY
ncbi:MAG TPA: 2-oxoacid:ferredoxin oxidoreductase subunit beta [Clostridiales bacterium]|nr:2-oxoacid:ferredoxin oxidoreductase subunit beta [Clostridiales bacterium]